MMYQKQKGLAMNTENPERIYIIETKIVSPSSLAMGTEKNPPKIAPQSRNVVENKWRKIARFPALQDIDENKRVKPSSP